MLVLTRHPGKKVVFSRLGVTIEILRSRGSVTRLGIGAPDDVLVLRDEVLAKRTALADAPSSSPQLALAAPGRLLSLSGGPRFWPAFRATHSKTRKSVLFLSQLAMYAIGMTRIPRADKIMSVTSVSLVVVGVSSIGLSHLPEWEWLCHIGEWLIVAGIAVYSLPLTFILLILPLSFVWQNWSRRK